MPVTVVGAGLAGSEAAWQIAEQGIEVHLYEMRPVRSTPAHRTAAFAELVCSNSLRAAAVTNAVGLLKEEMRQLHSVIMRCADANQVPAGGALAVNRVGFSEAVTAVLSNHPLIHIHREEVCEVPSEGLVVLATGPLTSPALSQSLASVLGEDYLFFFDAASPIVNRDSIDMEKAYFASRYDKGPAAYLNCPMTEAQFADFYEALVNAETAEVHDFEQSQVFEGCMPIEVMAARGLRTLLFGPMKPVGLLNPRTGQRPFAVVQLRQDDAAGSLYNMVGFQTHLKWGEQKRVFRMIPGLEAAEFVRFGVMHRNTYVNSPELLLPTYQTKGRATLFLAGQVTGVEGYVESAASGLLAGVNAARMAAGKAPVEMPLTTVIGSLAHYITHTDGHRFQPMNATFGLLPPLNHRVPGKRERNQVLADRALRDLVTSKARIEREG